jgi:hypothetical protein
VNCNQKIPAVLTNQYVTVTAVLYHVKQTQGTCRGIVLLIQDTASRKGWVSAPHHSHFTLGKRPSTRGTGGCEVQKISLPPEFEPRTVQHVASRSSDCTLPDHLVVKVLFSIH